MWTSTPDNSHSQLHSFAFIIAGLSLTALRGCTLFFLINSLINLSQAQLTQDYEQQMHKGQNHRMLPPWRNKVTIHTTNCRLIQHSGEKKNYRHLNRSYCLKMLSFSSTTAIIWEPSIRMLRLDNNPHLDKTDILTISSTALTKCFYILVRFQLKKDRI